MNGALLRSQLAPRFLRLKAARELASQGTLASLKLVEEVLPQLDDELVDCLLEHWPASGRHELCALLLTTRRGRARLGRRWGDPVWVLAGARSLLERPSERLAEQLLSKPLDDPALRGLVLLAAGRLEAYCELDFDGNLLKGLLARASPASRSWLLQLLAGAGRGDLVARATREADTPLAYLSDEDFEQRMDILGEGELGSLLARLKDLRPVQAARLVERLRQQGFQPAPESAAAWSTLSVVPIPSVRVLRGRLSRPTWLDLFPDEPARLLGCSPDGRHRAWVGGDTLTCLASDGDWQAEAGQANQLEVSTDGVVCLCDGLRSRAWSKGSLLWECWANRLLAGPGGELAFWTDDELWLSKSAEPPIFRWQLPDYALPGIWSFYADNPWLGVGLSTGQVLCISVEGEERPQAVAAHTRPVRHLQGSRERLVTACDLEVTSWECRDGVPGGLEFIQTLRCSASSLSSAGPTLALSQPGRLLVVRSGREWQCPVDARAIQVTRLGVLVADPSGHPFLWDYQRDRMGDLGDPGFAVEAWGPGGWALGRGRAARISPVPLADQPLSRIPMKAVEMVGPDCLPFMSAVLGWLHQFSIQLGEGETSPFDVLLD